ncbi:hypothetical protein [Shimia marina]|uniref:hypothetical protein n=1 Tax=Shimia marina TaxID=321267 RepID=UPI00071DDBD4|nr:hypothetical protein [Shimia marina]
MPLFEVQDANGRVIAVAAPRAGEVEQVQIAPLDILTEPARVMVIDTDRRLETATKNAGDGEASQSHTACSEAFAEVVNPASEAWREMPSAKFDLGATIDGSAGHATATSPPKGEDALKRKGLSKPKAPTSMQSTPVREEVAGAAAHIAEKNEAEPAPSKARPKRRKRSFKARMEGAFLKLSLFSVFLFGGVYLYQVALVVPSQKSEAFTALIAVDMYYFGDSEEARTSSEAEIFVPVSYTGDTRHDATRCALSRDDYDTLASNGIWVLKQRYAMFKIWRGHPMNLGGFDCSYVPMSVSALKREIYESYPEFYGFSTDAAAVEYVDRKNLRGLILYDQRIDYSE